MGLNRERSRGFTLIEMLVAVFIFGLTASAFAAMLQMSAKTQTMAANYQQAATMVQHKMDQLRGVGYGRLTYSELLAAGIIDPAPNAPPYQFTATDSLASLQPNCSGTIDVADYSSDTKQVTVRVRWLTGPDQRSDGDVTVTALIAKP